MAHMFFWLLVLLGCTAADVQADSPAASLAHRSPEEIDRFLKALQVEPDPVQRLLIVSERFLGTLYRFSPLGEGPGHPPDPDPLIRFDAVDCLTFLEEVMALSGAISLVEAQAVLQRIRYVDGRVEYRSRKHFTMAQWIPLNQRQGYLADITEQIGGSATVWVTKRLGPTEWRLRREPDKWPQLEPEEVPSGEFRLPIVPLSSMAECIGRIPPGTILTVVREDLRTVPTRVTHQGLVIVRDGQRFLRHAARAIWGQVVDEPLEGFLTRNRAYQKWVVSGFNFQRILWPAALPREQGGDEGRGRRP